MKHLGVIFICCYIFFSVSCGSDKEKNFYYFAANKLTSLVDTNSAKEIMNTQPDTSFNRLIFGKPRFIQLYYSKDSTELRFKDGKLIEVIIHKPLIDYKPESITQFGLPFIEPTDRDTSAFFMWKNKYEGFEIINFYLVGIRKNERTANYKIYFKLK